MKTKYVALSLPLVALSLAISVVPFASFAQKTSAGNRSAFPTLYYDPFADRFDTLEKFKNTYGSIGIKQPDVWGQARIMQHRSEYENTMASDLTNFSATFEGARSFVEQTSFSSGLAVSAGLTGSLPQFSGSLSNSLLPTNFYLPSNSYVAQTIAVPTNSVKSFGPDASIRIDPTEILDQKSRYIQHLQELRRINEGDDTADSAGYSLYLLRMPISISSGQKTKKGYGAEVTMSLYNKPTPDLFQKTFRRLSINDIALQLSQALVGLINSKELSDYAASETESRKTADNAATAFVMAKKALSSQGTNESKEQYQSTLRGVIFQGIVDVVEQHANLSSYPLWRQFAQKGTAMELPQDFSDATAGEFRNRLLNLVPAIKSDKAFMDAVDLKASAQGAVDFISSKLNLLQPDVSELTDLALKGKDAASKAPPKLSSSRFSKGSFAFPRNELFDIYGLTNVAELAVRLKQDLSTDSKDGDISVLAIQEYLLLNLNTAYDILCTRAFRSPSGLRYYWTPGTTFYNSKEAKTNLLELPGIIKALNMPEVINARAKFLEDFEGASEDGPIALSLVWPIVVESSLLASQINDEIQTTVGGTLHLQEDPLMLKPDPDDETLFAKYVNSRWPVHVFALDPVEETQNIQDSSSFRHDLQLSLSVAIATGKINASQYQKFTKDTALDLSAVYLNHTITAFSSGSNVFGWRFSPRFSTKENPDNAVIDSGERECTAVVVIPSFMSGIIINSRTRWFSLNCPAKTEPPIEKMYQLSDYWQSLTNMMDKEDSNVFSQDRHRQQWLFDSLAGTLPLQSLYASLPYETALGGFTLFGNQGENFLAPDLFGFEGTPFTDGTNDINLFLIGNHFSVRGTHVTASGTEIANPLLLSRQLMQIRIPGAVAKQATNVDVSVATPYGFAGPITIPVKLATFNGANAGPATNKSGYTWLIKLTPATNWVAGLTVNRPTGADRYNKAKLDLDPPDPLNGLPMLGHTSTNIADNIFGPDSALVRFRISAVSGTNESLVYTTSKQTFQMDDNGSFIQKDSTPVDPNNPNPNKDVPNTANAWKNIWTEVAKNVSGKLDQYVATNTYPADLSLKIGAYIQLPNGTVVQPDNPLVVTLQSH